MADIAVALGFEKLPKGAIPSTAFRPWQLAQGFNVQPANYALETMEYMHKYGVDIDQVSAVTIKNHSAEETADDVYVAVISMAIKEYLDDIHDTESGIITITPKQTKWTRI